VGRPRLVRIRRIASGLSRVAINRSRPSQRRMNLRLTCGPSAGRTWRVTLHREELLVAATGLTLTLDEIEFADMVVVAESEEDQAAIAESVFAGRGLQ
jgi:hypothetical protein